MSRRHAALIAGTCVAALGVAAAWRTPTTSARMLFTGDILLSRQVAVELSRTKRSPLDSIATVFATADWVAGNLEGAIGPESSCRVEVGAPCFATIDTAALLLARARFNAVSIENNHAGDLGAEGRVSTRAALRGAGVLGLDFERSPRFAHVGNLTVAIIAITTVPAADGQSQRIPSVELAQKLRLARSLASIVVVSVHWGTELQDWPSAAQRSEAEWLVDHGTDLVVGHHPHVVQAPDCVHGRPVFFSLGNHVFDQKYPATKEGLIADCTVRGARLRCGGLRTQTRYGSATPVAAGMMDSRGLDDCAPRVSPPPAFAGYEIRPEPWSASSPDSGVVLEGWRDGAIRWRTRRARLVSLSRGLAADGRTPLLLALERHPSAMDGELALRPHVYDVDDHGFVAKWRGTALAWPLVDAIVDAQGDLCALHRGDSFIRPDARDTTTRTMRYRWNGFGFSAAQADRGECAREMRALVAR